MSRTRSLALLAASVLALAGLAGCGDDDGAGNRSASASGSGSASGGSASGSGSGSGSPVEAQECTPVGEDLAEDAVETVDITLQDFAFDPPVIEIAEAGAITFHTTNEGSENHELAFLPGGGEVPFADGAPDEAALEEAGAFELEGYGPDQSCDATFELEAGEYTIFCIVESEDGEYHVNKGMQGTVTVG